MSVIHLQRSTKLNRISMSAANMLCHKYAMQQNIHKLIWGIVAKTPNKAIKYTELELVVGQLLSARSKLIDHHSYMDF